MLSIIITHHHTPELLQRCLQSLGSVLESIEGEIIVCDNCCHGQCQKDQWPQVKFLCFSQNQGYTKLVNAGLKHAKGDYFLILNADTMVPEAKDVLLTLDYLRQHQRVGLIGPRLVGIDQKWQPSCFREHSILTVIYRRTFLSRTKLGQRLTDRLLYQDRDLNTVQEADWLMGSALMTTRKVIETVGLLDERFKMYFSDADWARRCRLHNLRVVYFPNAILVHRHQRSSDHGRGILDLFFNRMTRVHVKDAVKYFWKWRS